MSSGSTRLAKKITEGAGGGGEGKQGKNIEKKKEIFSWTIDENWTRLTRYFIFVRRIHRKSRSSTVRRMGAWVDDRFAAEEAVPIIQGPRRRKASRILGHVCDGCGPDAIHRQCFATRNFFVLDSPRVSPSSLLPLRRQFTRQLYEWPGLPLFKSRTKLDQF